MRWKGGLNERSRIPPDTRIHIGNSKTEISGELEPSTSTSSLRLTAQRSRDICKKKKKKLSREKNKKTMKIESTLTLDMLDISVLVLPAQNFTKFKTRIPCQRNQGVR